MREKGRDEERGEVQKQFEFWEDQGLPRVPPNLTDITLPSASAKSQATEGVPFRSPLKWHGGKFYLAETLISLMPEHDGYGEVFFGAGHVLFRKTFGGIAEAVNDIDSRLTNFWEVLQNQAAFDEFYRILEATPLSEPRFLRAKEGNQENGVEGALNFFIRYRQSRQALGASYVTATSRTRRGMNEQVSAWLSSVAGLPQARERLIRVEIRNLDAVAFIAKYDRPDFLFYLDPPYMHETRTAKNAYTFEMSDRAHAILLATLQSSKLSWLSAFRFNQMSGKENYDSYLEALGTPLEGKFLLSGYPSALYSRWEKANGFRRAEVTIDNKASLPKRSANSDLKSKPKMTECIWMNY